MADIYEGTVVTRNFGLEAQLHDRSFVSADAHKPSDCPPELTDADSTDISSASVPFNAGHIKAHKKQLLTVSRDGNFGGDKPKDCYYQSADIEAVPGVVYLSDIDCDGYHSGFGEFEILSVDNNEIKIKIEEKIYTVTADNPVEVEKTRTETSYDGPRWTAYDNLEISIKQVKP